MCDHEQKYNSFINMIGLTGIFLMNMQAVEKIYQLKMTLDNIRPPVWRRVLIPASATFRDLHETIQLSFGWSDYHLHDFQTKSFAENRPHSITDLSAEDIEPWWDDDKKSDERLVKLYDVLHSADDQCRYWYDFGDDWWHTITLEKLLPQERNTQYPFCIKGKRSCPPEDCGGPWGYTELCAILANPSHPEHEDKLEWLGLDNASDFDQEDFDVDTVNQLLRDGYEAWNSAPATTK